MGNSKEAEPKEPTTGKPVKVKSNVQTSTKVRKKEQRPPRELSQAAVASFIYGTLQLILTLIGGAAVLAYNEFTKTITALTSHSPVIPGLPEGTDIEEITKQINEMSGLEVPTAPIPDPASSGVPDLSQFTPTASPNEIVPFEFLAILVTNVFGVLGIITVIFAFIAIGKGKSGNGLAVAGFMSSGLALILSSLIAMTL